jgi:hypothetical protein
MPCLICEGPVKSPNESARVLIAIEMIDAHENVMYGFTNVPRKIRKAGSMPAKKSAPINVAMS